MRSIAAKHGRRIIPMPSARDTAGGVFGSFGDLTVFSFHLNKEMNSIERRDRRHDSAGQEQSVDSAAQIGIDQFRRLDRFNGHRQPLADLYFRKLDGFGGVVLPARGGSGHAWHMFQLARVLEVSLASGRVQGVVSLLSVREDRRAFGPI